MSYFEDYLESVLPMDLENDKEAKAYYTRFQMEFPRNSISDISMERYLFAKEGYGYDNSFCRQLMYQPIASMGNSFPSIFGIYIAGGTELKLSRTYERYGADLEGAFSEIKEEICKLLKAGENLDYDYIENCRLHSTFKNILLATYLPELFLPAPTTTALDAYCEALCYSFPQNTSMAYKNHSLVEWMNSVSSCEGWDSFILMRFCDWLWRSGKTIAGKDLVDNKIEDRANEISAEIECMDLDGKDKEAITRIRVNQGIFRDRLLNRYHKCCLCGVSTPILLIASHIKPWSVSEASEKLDVNNGFLMCPNHDRLFDMGFISFDDEGKIIIAPELTAQNQVFMNVNDKMHIDIVEKNKKYLKYHRTHIFRG